jgi:AraC-like DNA-binding protein
MKIEKAKSLLITPMPITDIVYACGFADHSHFTRTFSRLAGVAPKAWRLASHHTVASPPAQTHVFDLDMHDWGSRDGAAFFIRR